MLLMGGQACVFYGAAEFSRDLDLLILADPENLEHLRSALAEMGAERVAVPRFEARHLSRGHAVHFRCTRSDVAGLRIDVMAVLRGVAGFEELWERRSTVEVDGETVDLLGIEDLVRAKKTQSDKDWPMIRRLVEQSYFGGGGDNPEQVRFWLRELRTPELLLRVAAANLAVAGSLSTARPAIGAALEGSLEAVSRALDEEEREERRKDREYWEPLKRELEDLRRARR
ncbi:MAG TPA: hypothetical protein VMS37_00515 [Verrucomicrobiae bacterium]|nr:hypothetical protein [Verrucomicrobiae bacterium]